MDRELTEQRDLVFRCLAYDFMCGSDDEVNSAFHVPDSDMHQVHRLYEREPTDIITMSGTLSEAIWNALFERFGRDQLGDAMIELCDFMDDFASVFARITKPVYDRDGILAMKLVLLLTHEWAAMELHSLLHDRLRLSIQLAAQAAALHAAYTPWIAMLQSQLGERISHDAHSTLATLIADLRLLVDELPTKYYAQSMCLAFRAS